MPHLNEHDANAEIQKFKAHQKAYTNGHLCKLLNNFAAVSMSSSPQKAHATEYSGDQYPNIHLMQVLELYPLMTGHTFAKKETLQICIAEETNLRNIKVKVLKSCKIQYAVAGDNFYVKASNLVYKGCKVHVCVCGENYDPLRRIPTRAM